jgi:hypothetical protein
LAQRTKQDLQPVLMSHSSCIQPVRRACAATSPTQSCGACSVYETAGATTSIRLHAGKAFGDIEVINVPVFMVCLITLQVAQIIWSGIISILIIG